MEADYRLLMTVHIVLDEGKLLFRHLLNSHQKPAN